MCGIVGYVGPSEPSGRPLAVVLEGLRRLEYRGYDSAGVALTGTGDGVAVAKKAGKLANLVADLHARPLAAATTAIGHTRWATHGAPTDANAHPHVAGRVAVIHNGIVENFAALKAELVADGVTFASETDTEVVAHLLDRAWDGDLAEAMRRVVRRLHGTFTLLAVHADAPGVVVGARHDSPLVVGLGEGENFLGSDVAAFIAHTREALELGQDQVVTITAAGVEVTDFDGTPAQGRRYTVDWDASAAEKGGFRSFMDKEIHDEPQAVADTLLGRTDESRPAGARRDAHRRVRAARRRQDRRRRLRHRRLRRARRQVRHRALVPHPRRGRAGPRVPLPRPGGRRAHAGGGDLPVRGDDGHPDGGAARPRAGRDDAGHRQHPRLDDPAGVRRRAVHPRRA